MITTLIASTLAFTAQAPAEPQLSLQQRTSIRCSAAFAIVAKGQEAGNSEALAYPDLSERGKEFFVRASAQTMEEAGLTRDQISAVLSAEAHTLWDDGTLANVMPGCLLLLDASGL
ncbi:hypothetical protein ACXYL9_00285 [Qipengyuania sp. CAU 1752]